MSLLGPGNVNGALLSFVQTQSHGEAGVDDLEHFKL